MKKILDWFTKWDKDKILHVLLSLSISIGSVAIIKLIGGNEFEILIGAFGFGFIAGSVKELYDECVYKGADFADFVADMIGVLFGTGVSYLLVC